MDDCMMYNSGILVGDECDLIPTETIDNGAMAMLNKWHAEREMMEHIINSQKCDNECLAYWSNSIY